MSLTKVGDVLRTQGDLAGALTSYREGLEIMRELSTKDPGNTEWQRDVSVNLNRVGDMLQGKAISRRRSRPIARASI